MIQPALRLTWKLGVNGQPKRRLFVGSFLLGEIYSFRREVMEKVKYSGRIFANGEVRNLESEGDDEEEMRRFVEQLCLGELLGLCQG